MTYAESGLFWSQCFLPSLVIRKAQAGAGKSSLGLLWSNARLSGKNLLSNSPGLPALRGVVETNDWCINHKFPI